VYIIEGLLRISALCLLPGLLLLHYFFWNLFDFISRRIYRRSRLRRDQSFFFLKFNLRLIRNKRTSLVLFFQLLRNQFHQTFFLKSLFFAEVGKPEGIGVGFSKILKHFQFFI